MTTEKIQSVAIVATRRERVLLIEHKFRGTIGLPGGKKERGETDAQACIRECEEETALSVTRVGKVILESETQDRLCKLYACDVDFGDPVAGDDAAKAWFGFPSEINSDETEREAVSLHIHEKNMAIIASVQKHFPEATSLVVGKSDIFLSEGVKRTAFDDFAPSFQLLLSKCYDLPVGAYDLRVKS